MKCQFCGRIATSRTLKGGHAIRACNNYAINNPEICKQARNEYEEQNRQIRLTKISVEEGPEEGTDNIEQEETREIQDDQQSLEKATNGDQHKTNYQYHVFVFPSIIDLFNF